MNVIALILTALCDFKDSTKDFANFPRFSQISNIFSNTEHVGAVTGFVDGTHRVV